MKGNEQVMIGLQEAINLEASLMLQYTNDASNATRYGLSIGDGLKKLHDQSETFMESLVGRLLFLEGAPSIAPNAAKTHVSVTDIVTDAYASEVAIVDRYATLCREAFDAGDMDNFHYYQHLSKWHRQGGNGFDGHLSWIQKQGWQLKELGEKDFEQAKV